MRVHTFAQHAQSWDQICACMFLSKISEKALVNSVSKLLIQYAIPDFVDDDTSEKE